MSRRGQKKSYSIHIVLSVLFFILLASFFLKSSDAADNAPDGSRTLNNRADSDIPTEYGCVVYRYNERSRNQIYIIGLSHRDALTGAPGDTTLKAQIETYEIGEWLVRNEGLELLLPEGFFGPAEKADKADAAGQTHRTTKQATKGGMLSGDETLEKLLGDEKHYINAEMLLNDRYDLDTQQIEDSKLYFDVEDKIARIEKCGSNADDFFVMQSEVEYLQSLRTARMFQNIPAIVEREYRSGHIRNEKALFTIGLAHIYDIITFLNKNKIAVYPPLFAPSVCKEFTAEMDLLKYDFGVTIIIPKTLADNQNILKATRLYKMVAR